MPLEDHSHFSWVPLGGGMLDQIRCVCGWESNTYFDGDDYAYAEWKKHVKDKEDERAYGAQQPSGGS